MPCGGGGGACGCPLTYAFEFTVGSPVRAMLSMRARTQGETLSYLACHILDDWPGRHGTHHTSVEEAAEYVSFDKLESIALRIPANSHMVEQVAVVVDTHSRFVEADSRHSFVVV